VFGIVNLHKLRKFGNIQTFDVAAPSGRSFPNVEIHSRGVPNKRGKERKFVRSFLKKSSVKKGAAQLPPC
jgi:hypothetical protein